MSAGFDDDYTSPAGEEDQSSDSWANTFTDAALDTYQLRELPPPRAIITDLLFHDSVNWIGGKAGSGKSFVALDLAGCVATGQPWQDRGTRQGKVLYIAAEGISGLKLRAAAWESSYGRDLQNLTFLPLAPQTANYLQWKGLKKYATENHFDLIIIDTQARVTVGLEENAAKDMGVFVDRLEQLRACTAACIVVIHHQGRAAANLRGSSAMDGAGTTILQISKEGHVITVHCEKQKDAEQFDDFALLLSPHLDSAVLVLSGDTMPDKVKTTLATQRAWWDTFGDEWVSQSKLAKAGVGHQATLYRHCRILVAAGTVRRREASKPDAAQTRYVYQLAAEPPEDA